MSCPKCHGSTRVDLQSLIDCEGVKYRRACVACSWDVWEVQPGKPADTSWASLAQALEAAVADIDVVEASEQQPRNGHGQRRERGLGRHGRGDGHPGGRERAGHGPVATVVTEDASPGRGTEEALGLAAPAGGAGGRTGR